jgi:Pyruvate/2-oxoacid:ferredoxin oxidoreductase delta subunit
VIYVDQVLCVGCGTCINECPTGAISLSDGEALVDSALCDGCGSFDEIYDRVCVEICPNEALSWVAEPMPESATEASSLVVVGPSVKVIPAQTRVPVPWHRAVLPAVGGALTWVGREVVPRLAPLALDVLDGVLDRRHSIRRRPRTVSRQSHWVREEDATPVPSGRRGGRGRQQRRRQGRGRS